MNYPGVNKFPAEFIWCFFLRLKFYMGVRVIFVMNSLKLVQVLKICSVFVYTFVLDSVI